MTQRSRNRTAPAGILLALLPMCCGGCIRDDVILTTLANFFTNLVLTALGSLIP